MQQPLPSYDGDEPYVFVSYSHTDKDIARNEIRWLQDQGFNVWWDEGISPGSAWRQELAQALRNCSLIVFLVTPNSVASDQCTREIHFGQDEYKRPVLAVHLIETKLPDALGLSLSDRQAILKHAISDEDYARKLGHVVAAALEVPVPALSASRAMQRRSPKIREFAGPVALVLLAVLATAGVMSFILKPTTETPALTARFSVDMPPGAQLSQSSEHIIDITSDGRRVFFIAEMGGGLQRLFMRDLSALEVVMVEGADSPPGEELRGVFLSPDDTQLLLYYRGNNRSPLRRLPVQGGIPAAVNVQLNDAANLRLHWGDTNRIFYRDADTIWETTADFSSRVAVVTINDDYNTIAHPYFVAETNSLLYVRASLNNNLNVKPSVIEVKSLETGTSSLQLANGSWPRVTADGTLVFRRGNHISAVRLNAERTSIAGQPITVSQEVNFGSTGFGQGYTFTEAGTLAYIPSGNQNIQNLIWVSIDGARKGINLPGQPIYQATVSPDELKIAYTAGTAGTDLWIYSLIDELQSRTTYDNVWTFAPRWSPDSQSIAYTSYQRNISEIRAATPASGTNRLLHKALETSVNNPSVWLNEQQSLLVHLCKGVNISCDIAIVDNTVQSEASVVIGHEAFNERFPVLSTDEKYIAYLSDEFGADRVVIRPYPEVDTAFWQIPVDNCTYFKWTRAGRLIAQSGQTIYSIDVDTTGESPSIGNVKKIYELNPGEQLADVTEDASRLLVIESAAGASQIVIQTNWLDGVGRKLTSQ